ncbi:WD repeat-containing protein 11 [Ixodes scapularis]
MVGATDGGMSPLARDSSEKRSDDGTVNPVIKKISSRILPGALAPANKDAIEWGFQSLLAYGCHKHIVVVDTKYAKVFQTLSGHNHNVTKVRWSRHMHYHDLVNPYHLKLASADTSGTVLVWDISQATVRSTLTEPDRALLEMNWLVGGDSSHHLLLTLYSLGTLVLWHADSGAQLWRKNYADALLSFSLDPFCENAVCFLAADCLLLVEDLSGQQAPVGVGSKWHVSGQPGGTANDEKNRPKSRLLSGVKSLMRATDSRIGADEEQPLSECLQLCYHGALRYHLLLLYPKRLMVLDTEIQQTLGVISLERNGSPFVRCQPCWQHDMILCLHESGSVSARVRQRDQEEPCARGDFGHGTNQVNYTMRCISEALRLTKHSKVFGLAVRRSGQHRMALLIGDGRLLFLELAFSKQPGGGRNGSLSELLAPNVGLRLPMSGLLEALAPGPHLTRMCPPVTFGNWSSYRPLLAVGNNAGGVQVFDLSTGVLEKEFNLHATPVRGIEWVSLTSFLSFAYANLTGVGGKVKNEIVLTSTGSGRVRQVRAEANEESPVCAIRVSHLKQYFVVLFKEQPFELWDLRTLTLLRTMPDNFPCVTSLEWSPLVSGKAQLRARQASGRKDADASVGDRTVNQLERQPSLPSAGPPLREQLVFTDADAQLYYFTVEGNVVRDCTRNPPEAGMASITSIAWKSDYIVLGDADGTLTVWDLKGKVLRTLPTQRGCVKRLKFGPGKGNMKVLALFADGLDVWDAQEVQLSVQARCPQDLPGVSDVDWAKSDKLVVATLDGCVRIVDMELKGCSSPVASQLDTSRVPFVPHLLPPKATLRLKSQLQHLSPAGLAELVTPERAPGETALVDKLLQAWAAQRAPSDSLATGVAERSLSVASWFGDEEALRFWSVALHYLASRRPEKASPDLPTAEATLGPCYDLWCPNPFYKALQLERLLLHESRRTTHSHTQRCACRLLLLGQSDRAVQLLLETDTCSEHFHSDSLRACLIASLKTETKAQSVVKLVATNLIASGRTWDGVQLLCLIGKGLDACRYLQAAGQWGDSVWLAKCTLGETECGEVVRRWADYLLQQHQKGKALLTLLSIGQFTRCIEVLHASRMVERAALLLDACIEWGLLPSGDLGPQQALATSVWLDYARYLHSVGNRTASLRYCQLAGDAASDLCRELEMLLDEEATQLDVSPQTDSS